jgi:hypothetical protein
LGGAALQILATLAVVRTLDPSLAGIYFKGFIVACGLGALLRNKYELYVTRYIIGRRAAEVGVPFRDMLMDCGRRVLVRGCVACAVLLVMTCDLDILEPHLHPYLQTFLPFVLATPLSALAGLLASCLRAADRSLGGMIVSAYTVNTAILAAAFLLPATSLEALSWAFLGGSLLAAGLAGLFVHRAFPTLPASPPVRASWDEVHAGIDQNGRTGLSQAGLLWGPMCLLAWFAPDEQMALFAVASRSAQVVDFLLPALAFVPYRDSLRMFWRNWNCSARQVLLRELLLGVSTGSLAVAALALAAWPLLKCFGPPYTGALATFFVLLAVQWANASARAAVRYLTIQWHTPTIQRILGLSAVLSMLACAAGFALLNNTHAALVTAAAMLSGALLINGQSLATAWRLTPRMMRPSAVEQ